MMGIVVALLPTLLMGIREVATNHKALARSRDDNEGCGWGEV
jgi:hypothetical protein